MTVTGVSGPAQRRRPGLIDLLYRPEVRSILFQTILLILLVALFWMLISNTAANL